MGRERWQPFYIESQASIYYWSYNVKVLKKIILDANLFSMEGTLGYW